MALVFRVSGGGGGASYSNSYSIDFDPNDSIYLEANSTSALDTTDGSDAFSVSVWFKPETHRVSAIFSKGTNGAQFTTLYSGIIDFIFGNRAGVNIQCRSNTNLTSGEWNHIVGTYDGSANTSGIKIYLNGNDTTTSLYKHASFTTSTSTSNSTAFRIGGYASNVLGGSQTEIDGRVDEFSYWGKALSSSEVTEIYNSGTPDNLADHSAYDDLTSWYRMGDHASDDLTADTGQITDAKGSNHLTPKNTTSDNKVEDTPGS